MFLVYFHQALGHGGNAVEWYLQFMFLKLRSGVSLIFEAVCVCYQICRTAAGEDQRTMAGPGKRSWSAAFKPSDGSRESPLPLETRSRGVGMSALRARVLSRETALTKGLLPLAAGPGLRLELVTSDVDRYRKPLASAPYRP